MGDIEWAALEMPAHPLGRRISVFADHSRSESDAQGASACVGAVAFIAMPAGWRVAMAGHK